MAYAAVLRTAVQQESLALIFLTVEYVHRRHCAPCTCAATAVPSLPAVACLPGVGLQAATTSAVRHCTSVSAWVEWHRSGGRCEVRGRASGRYTATTHLDAVAHVAVQLAASWPACGRFRRAPLQNRGKAAEHDQRIIAMRFHCFAPRLAHQPAISAATPVRIQPCCGSRGASCAAVRVDATVQNGRLARFGVFASACGRFSPRNCQQTVVCAMQRLHLTLCDVCSLPATHLWIVPPAHDK